ncbi:rhodanese-like domain-containing protein [Rhodococcus opacus]|uniref:rhodanese-like domain-containing protein n=1 Tax=Rhodococcus opacus TaxID=37919 RepID=UPI001C491330|nr:rhodanese-like domain-containing protein [Rhodococcus opacus]MBV6757351.1 rhodanese-like domain-containing protein [Rhodococcus opacus]
MREIETMNFADAWADGAPVVDACEWEYVDRHVPGALMMPLGQLRAHAAEIPAADVVYVNCAFGNREGARIVQARGRSAVSVAGGTSDRVTAGRPVDTGDRE